MTDPYPSNYFNGWFNLNFSPPTPSLAYNFHHHHQAPFSYYNMINNNSNSFFSSHHQSSLSPPSPPLKEALPLLSLSPKRDHHQDELAEDHDQQADDNDDEEEETVPVALHLGLPNPSSAADLISRLSSSEILAADREDAVTTPNASSPGLCSSPPYGIQYTENHRQRSGTFNRKYHQKVQQHKLHPLYSRFPIIRRSYDLPRLAQQLCTTS